MSQKKIDYVVTFTVTYLFSRAYKTSDLLLK